MNRIINYSWILVFLTACGGHKEPRKQAENLTPQVMDNGIRIVFPTKKSSLFFETEMISSGNLDAQLTAPAKVSATVIKSDEEPDQTIILFENPDLAANYSQLIQHLINIHEIQSIDIKQKKTELERTKDLQLHGAATGRDLLEAQTALMQEEANLANEKAANIEHETKLRAGGFQPEQLRTAKPGTAYIICDIPESQINTIKEGSKCTLQFTSFSNEKMEGRIENIADMIDQSSRMIKLRVSVNNADGRLKAGMFATVSFPVSEGNGLSVSKNALITIQSKNYVFVKKDSVTFLRQEVATGNQINDRIIVFNGLKNGDSVAVKGVMQLKGLSFGY